MIKFFAKILLLICGCALLILCANNSIGQTISNLGQQRGYEKILGATLADSVFKLPFRKLQKWAYTNNKDVANVGFMQVNPQDSLPYYGKNDSTWFRFLTDNDTSKFPCNCDLDSFVTFHDLDSILIDSKDSSLFIGERIFNGKKFGVLFEGSNHQLRQDSANFWYDSLDNILYLKQLYFLGGTTTSTPTTSIIPGFVGVCDSTQQYQVELFSDNSDSNQSLTYIRPLGVLDVKAPSLTHGNRKQTWQDDNGVIALTKNIHNQNLETTTNLGNYTTDGIVIIDDTVVAHYLDLLNPDAITLTKEGIVTAGISSEDSNGNLTLSNRHATVNLRVVPDFLHPFTPQDSIWFFRCSTDTVVGIRDTAIMHNWTVSQLALKQNNSDTNTFDATRSWVLGLGYTTATGTVTSVTAGSGLSGGVIMTSGTISMPNVGTPGTYGSGTQVPVITTDAQGRITSVTNTTIPISSGTVTNVATSTGILGGPITTTGTIQIDSSIIPKWNDTLLGQKRLVTPADLVNTNYMGGIGAIDVATPSVNAAVDSANKIWLQSASTTSPGVINIATQSFAGVKTFINTLVPSGNLSTNNSPNTSNMFISGGNARTTVTGTAALFQSQTSVDIRALITGNGSAIMSNGRSYAAFEIANTACIGPLTGTSFIGASMVVRSPTITPGPGAVTNGASIYIDGQSSGASNNYALFINGGPSALGGPILINTTVNNGAALQVNGIETLSSPVTGASNDSILVRNTAIGQIKQITIASLTGDTLAATGNTTLVVAAKKWLMAISFNPTSIETIKIGTTSGASDVMPLTVFPAGVETSVSFNKFFSRSSNTTLFIQGATGGVIYSYKIF